MNEVATGRRWQRLQWVRFALGTLAILVVIFFVVEWVERVIFGANEPWGDSLFSMGRGFLAAIIATAFATYLLVKRTRTAERRATLVEESMDNVFQIMDALPTGVMVVDRDGRPFYANQAAEHVLGQGLSSDATPEKLPEVYQAYIAGTDDLYPANRMPLYRALRGEKSAAANDVEIHQAGGVVPVRLVANPTRDEDGRVHHAVASLIDLRDLPSGRARRAAPKLGKRDAKGPTGPA